MAELVTKKRLVELQAVVDRRQREHAESNERLGQAQSEFFAAEREFKRNEKPTAAVLTILSVIANGGTLHCNHYSNRYYARDSEGKVVPVRDSVFYGLRDRQAVAVLETDRVRVANHRSRSRDACAVV